VLALDSQTLSITATCFQCHGYGRRTGLKIRWGNTPVGSSPTFGINCNCLAFGSERAARPTSSEARRFLSNGTRDITR
jgi:hypothetical protein